MDLFQSLDPQNLPGTPLPEQLRPQDFSSFVGQRQAVEQFQRYVQSGFLPNLILWGPPGTGKTTYARLLSKSFEFNFVALNAVQSGVKDLKETAENAKLHRLQYQRRTVVFVDEVHRFNKSQQDVLLPYIESGDITLIGATTENPSYELNKAILSRCRLIVFQKMSHADLVQLLASACKNKNLKLDEVLRSEAKDWFISWADGDARKLFLGLEEILAQIKLGASLPISEEQIRDLLGSFIIGHDKSSDSHYDLISAMIKSIRGSDVDAGLYYLARLIKGGEDPIFIARRLVILASEDVGNADPRAIQVALACAQAVEMIGLPEAGINLAQAVTYLASAPKSNRSYVAYKKALEFVEQTGSLAVPLKLRSANTAEMKQIGYGKDYRYPHDYPRNWVQQRYLPDEAQIKEPFYQPSDIGFEKQVKEFSSWLKK